jgi:hypothetical protein
LASQFSQAAKVAVIEKINEIVDFADSIVERLSQQNYAMVLFVLWCGLAVSAIRSRSRLALLQKQLDKLGHDVRQLELNESSRLMEAIHSRSRSESQTQQQDVPTITSPEENGGYQHSAGVALISVHISADALPEVRSVDAPTNT